MEKHLYPTLLVTLLSCIFGPLSNGQTIPVVFNVLHEDATIANGYLSEDHANDSIILLNQAFTGTGIQFHLHEVVYLQGPQFSSAEHAGPSGQTIVMCDISNFGANRNSPQNYVNIYTNKSANVGRLPWAYASEADCNHGVFMARILLPGGTLASKKEVFLHEMGHYLGLYHTFHRHNYLPTPPCTEDGILDTPPHTDLGCSTTTPSCTAGVYAPWANFMNATSETSGGCRTHFTTSQFKRMSWVLAHFRPSLGFVPGVLDVSNNNFFIHRDDVQEFVVWPAPVTIKASNKIVSSGGMSVYPGMNVTLRAPNEITLSGSLEITNATFAMEIGGVGKASAAEVETAPTDGMSQYIVTEPVPMPAGYSLEVYPNPLRETAYIKYMNDSEGAVTVRIFDVSGRLVRELTNGLLDRGLHMVVWDGKDGAGRRVASGTYFCRVLGPLGSSVIPVIVIR